VRTAPGDELGDLCAHAVPDHDSRPRRLALEFIEHLEDLIAVGLQRGAAPRLGAAGAAQVHRHQLPAR
jgi:hypothetical protein